MIENNITSRIVVVKMGFIGIFLLKRNVRETIKTDGVEKL